MTNVKNRIDLIYCTYKCVRFDFMAEKDSRLTLDILLFHEDLNEDII